MSTDHLFLLLLLPLPLLLFRLLLLLLPCCRHRCYPCRFCRYHHYRAWAAERAALALAAAVRPAPWMCSGQVAAAAG